MGGAAITGSGRGSLGPRKQQGGEKRLRNTTARSSGGVETRPLPTMPRGSGTPVPFSPAELWSWAGWSSALFDREGGRDDVGGSPPRCCTSLRPTGGWAMEGFWHQAVPLGLRWCPMSHYLPSSGPGNWFQVWAAILGHFRVSGFSPISSKWNLPPVTLL